MPRAHGGPRGACCRRRQPLLLGLVCVVYLDLLCVVYLDLLCVMDLDLLCVIYLPCVCRICCAGLRPHKARGNVDVLRGRSSRAPRASPTPSTGALPFLISEVPPHFALLLKSQT